MTAFCKFICLDVDKSMNFVVELQTTFRKPVPFPSSGERVKTLAMFGPLEKADTSQWTVLCLLVFTIPDDRQSIRIPANLNSRLLPQ
jgi:hypothetical protein